MPSFLSDPSPTIFLLLIAAAAGAGWYAFREQTRKSLRPLAVVLGLLLLLFVLDFAFESPREEATRKIQEMADAASNQQPDKFVEHVSERFDAGGSSREKLRNSVAWGIIKRFNARVAVWDFDRSLFEWTGDNEFKIEFLAKGESRTEGGFVMRYVRATFVRDPDGQYRLRDIKFYNPADKGMRVEEPIPGFP